MGGFRAPLDISQYVANVGGYGVLSGGEHREIQETNRRAAEAYAEQLASIPQKMGSGPAVFSTCTDLTTLADSMVIWDVNGYYRALGFTAPYRGITKARLRVAYIESGGVESERLTRILQLLMDPEERARYDRAPFGERRLDEIIQDDLTLRALHEAALRSQRGRLTTKDEVLDEWGLVLVPEPEDGALDPQRESVGAARHTAVDPLEREHWWEWLWGYYLWRSKSRQTERLAEWQALLIKQFAVHDITTRFCVGFHGGKASPSPWVTAVSGSHLVIFLHEDVEPTDEHAATAAAFVLNEHTDETVRKALPSMNAPKFGRGGSGAKERAKAMQNRPKTRFLSLEDGETVILRFIDDSDDWLQTMQHGFVPTKPAPADYPKEQKWPKTMGAVCRHDSAFADMYSDCFICDQMHDEEKDKPFRPSLRLWARALVRKPVIGTQEMVDEGLITEKKIGKRVGIVDSEVDDPEVDEKGEPTGKTVRQKEVIIVNMGMKNFFGPLQGAYEIYGTVLDRDYAVTRDGKGTDTDYSIVPLPEIKDPATGDVWTLEDPALRKRYIDIINLEKYVAEQASDDKYARFFDTTKKAPSRKKDGEGGTKAKAKARPVDEDDDDDDDATPEKSEVDQAALAAMKARVRGGSGAKAKAQPEPDDDDEDEDA